MPQQNHAEGEDFLQTRFSSASRPSFHSPVLQQDVLRDTSNVAQRYVEGFYLNPSAAQSYVSEDPESSYTFTPAPSSMSQGRPSRQLADAESAEPRHVPVHDSSLSLRGLSIRGSDRNGVNGQDSLVSPSLSAPVNPRSTAMLPIRGDGVLVVGYTHTDSGRKHTATWYFHGLTISQAEQLLAARGLQDIIWNCPPGGIGAGQSSSDAPKISTQALSNGFSAVPNRALNRTFNGNGFDARVDLAERQPMLEPLRYFACPFSKHDPDRYLHVRGPCTIGPGFMEFRRVKEHVRKFHAPPSTCPACKAVWNTEDSEDWNKEAALKAFRTHQGVCTKRSPFGILAHPEWLDEEQTQRVDDSDFRGKSTTEEKWKQFYENDLFPDPPGIDAPSPYYDYYVPSHRITATLNRSFDFTQINAPFYPNVPNPDNSHVLNGSLIDTTNTSFLGNSSGRDGYTRSSAPHGTINVPDGIAQHSDFGRRARQHRQQDSGYAVLSSEDFESGGLDNSRHDNLPQSNVIQDRVSGTQEGEYMDMGFGVPFYNFTNGQAGFVDFVQQEVQPVGFQMDQEASTTIGNGTQTGLDHPCMGPSCNYCWWSWEMTT